MNNNVNTENLKEVSDSINIITSKINEEINVNIYNNCNSILNIISKLQEYKNMKIISREGNENETSVSLWKISVPEQIDYEVNKILNYAKGIESDVKEVIKTSLKMIQSSEIIEKYNEQIENGLEINANTLSYIFNSTEKMTTNIAWDEYSANTEKWNGINKENIDWWTEKPIKFIKDPNGIGSKSYLIMRKNENNEWVGIGYTNETTVINYVNTFNKAINI